MRAPLPYAEFDPSRCLNCGTALPTGTRFCPRCGQPNRTHKRSLGEWASEGLSSFFHFEGRIWNTLRDLYVPGRVARNYLNGQRQRYVHPMRLLLFSSLLLLLAVQIVEKSSGEGGELEIISDGGDRSDSEDGGLDGATAITEVLASTDDWVDFDLDDLRLDEYPYATVDTGAVRAAIQSARVRLAGDSSVNSVQRDVGLAKLDAALQEFDVLAAAAEPPPPFGLPRRDPFSAQMRSIDILRMRLFTHDRLSAAADSARAAGLVTSPEARLLLDTLLAVFPEPSDTLLSGVFFAERVSLDNRKLAGLSTDEAVAQSGAEGWWTRVALSKAIDAIHDGQDSLNAYLLSTLSWAVLLFVPILALGYYGLYWRRLPYYTQHLSLVAFISGALLLGGAAVLLPTLWLRYPPWFWIVFGPAAATYIFATELRVYECVWWKTALKSLALSVYGSIAFVLALGLWLGLAMLLR